MKLEAITLATGCRSMPPLPQSISAKWKFHPLPFNSQEARHKTLRPLLQLLKKNKTLYDCCLILSHFIAIFQISCMYL